MKHYGEGTDFKTFDTWYNSLNTVRQDTVDGAENMGWCKPYETKNVEFCVTETEISDYIVFNGEEYCIDNINAILKILRTVCPEFEQEELMYSTFTLDEILEKVNEITAKSPKEITKTDIKVFKEIVCDALLEYAKEMDCYECPFFMDCELMDEA